MKNVNNTMKYNDLKVIAKELGIKFVGVKTQDLVISINKEIDARKTPTTKKEKWYTNGYGFQNGDMVEIISKTIEKAGVIKEILQGRFASIVGPSNNEGMVRAFLFDDKTGALLNCPITLEISKITKEESQLIAA